MCDGKDNDCDAKVDEDFEVGLPCRCDDKDVGVYACSEDGFEVICVCGDGEGDEKGSK